MCAEVHRSAILATFGGKNAAWPGIDGNMPDFCAGMESAFKSMT